MAEILNESVHSLMLGIVRQAVADYTYIANKINKGGYYSPKEYFDLRKFFKSEWFYALSNGIDGYWLLSELDETFVKGEIYWDKSSLNKPKRMPQKATDDECELIIKLRDVDKMSFPKIGDVVKRTGNSVYWIYNRYKRDLEKQKDGEKHDN